VCNAIGSLRDQAAREAEEHVPASKEDESWLQKVARRIQDTQVRRRRQVGNGVTKKIGKHDLTVSRHLIVSFSCLRILLVINPASGISMIVSAPIS
jgi:hypothetical protein